MSSIRLDYRFFVYVFVCYSISSLVFTGVMVYYISQIVDAHSKSTWRLVVNQEDKAPQDGNLWSRDPMVMQGLAAVRARGTHETMAATLIQVICNDSCLAFVWTRFHLQTIGKYKVLMTNIKVPTMTPISAVIRGLETEFVQCDLNVSTPYLVNLTAVGEDAIEAWEAASAVMWTTHQVPPPPDLPKIVSVTETTITVTLPWPTLTQGPLSALEIRVKPAATNHSSGDTNPRPLFWTRFFKRHKRSSEYLQLRGVLLRGAVDSPQSLPQSAREHGIVQDRRADDGLLKTGHNLASPQDGQAPGDYDVPHTDIPSTVVPYKVVISKDVPNKGVPYKDVPNKFVTNKVMSHKNVPNKATVGSERHKGTYARINSPQERMTSEDSAKAGFGTTNDRRAGDRHNDKLHSATVEVKLWPDQTRRKLKDTRRRSWLNNIADSFNVQSLNGQATSGDRMESKATDNGQLHGAITNFTWPNGNYMSPDGRWPDGNYMSPDGRYASDQHPHASDITWLETDIDPDLEGMFDLSRWPVGHNLFQPASLGEDMALLQQLTKNVQEQLTKNVQELLTKNVQEQLTKNVQQQLAKNVQEQLAKNVQQQLAKNVQEQLAKNVQQQLAKNVQEELTKNVQEELTKNVQEELTKNVQELLQPGRLSDNSSLDALRVSSLTHNMHDTGNLSAACPQCEGHRDILDDDIKAGPSLPPSPASTASNTAALASKMAMFARQFLATTSRRIVSRFVGQGTRAVSREKRSILGFGRHRRQPTAADVREMEDRLDVDPYQTCDVLMSSTGQPIRVKTGYGYFVTDHYGVRHPHFNNSLLERGLLRLARYQEARDFVLYGKSVLNLTEFKNLDLHLLYTRLGKIMEVNRMRRNKLFLDMFEDFLFWNQDIGDNQLGGTAVPHEAKLGLPPGVPVARVMAGGLSHNVTIGADKGHDQLANPPLEPDKEYEVVIVVLSTVMNVTKHAWISVNITTLPEQPRLVSTPILVVIGVAATGGLLVFVLSHLVLWLTYSRPEAPPGGGWQDVQPRTTKARTAEQAGCGHMIPGLTSYCDSGLPLIEPGGHIMDTSSWCLSASDLRSPRRKISSPALCDEKNNTDSTNDGHLHADKERCDIVEVRVDAVACQRGPGQDSPQEILHQRRLAGALLLQPAEQRPHSVFSLEEVV